MYKKHSCRFRCTTSRPLCQVNEGNEHALCALLCYVSCPRRTCSNTLESKDSIHVTERPKEVLKMCVRTSEHLRETMSKIESSRNEEFSKFGSYQRKILFVKQK